MYATCSLLPDENEAVAKAFGESHPAFEAVDVGTLLEGVHVEQAASLTVGDGQQRYLRLWPHRHGTDGFFAAVWQKNRD